MMMELFVLLLAYLFGSVPFGLLVGKIGYGIDIREHGSGNLGGTNTFRTLGVKAGLIVTIGDILKGTAATLLPLMLHLDVHPLLTGVMAVIGHMYPIFAGFRGGKAVATSGGVLLGYNPIMFVVLLLAFFVTLYLSKYVSLSSMVVGAVAVIYSFFTGDIYLVIGTSLLCVFVFYRHKANIKRIREKTEPKIKWL